MSNDIYIVNSDEKTTRSASVQETKTLLYLMGYIQESKDLDTFVIDVVNDVVAVDNEHTKYFDAQSKGDSSLSPKSIGKDLVTLFKDYLSFLNFDSYLLSIRKVSDLNINPDKRSNKLIKQLRFSNFTSGAQKDIKDGLVEECKVKSYIYEDYPNYENSIDNFLDNIIILINDESHDNYIRKVSFADNSAVSSEFLSSIFETIRAKQLEIKTKNKVHNLQLLSLGDQLHAGRNFKVESINLLIFERIIGRTLINNNSSMYYCPRGFLTYIGADLDEEELNDILNESGIEIYKALCGVNMNKEFWQLIFEILKALKSSKTINALEALDLITTNNPDLLYLNVFSKNALVYLICCMKEGLIYDN